MTFLKILVCNFKSFFVGYMSKYIDFIVWIVVGIWWTCLLLWRYFVSYGGIVDVVNYFSVDAWAVVDELEQTLEDFWLTGDMVALQSKYLYIDALLEKNYYNKDLIDHEKMHEHALKWYIGALGDPYTSYLSKEETEMFDEQMQWAQDFEGIWALVTTKEDGVLVEEVLKWMPAFLAWVEPLDIILEVDGVAVQWMDLFEVIELIRWPKWSSVVLTIFREKESAILEIEVLRDAIQVPSVAWEILRIQDKNILYIDIALMWEDTVAVFDNILASNTSLLDWVIMDVRWNGGWFLPVAVDIASYFVPKDLVITTTRYTQLPDEVLRSSGKWVLEWLPVVVLIDGLSASASEIIASALHDHVDALLIGEQSFGKGSIQTYSEVYDWSVVKYTIGKRYTSTDENVDHVWLAPDIDIAFDLDIFAASGRVDNQLERAKEEILLMIQ